MVWEEDWIDCVKDLFVFSAFYFSIPQWAPQSSMRLFGTSRYLFLW